MSEDANLVKYYADLSIIQYADKPKARAFMENILGALICYDLAVAVRDGFNLETAVGAQLDIIAKYVGVNRVITGVAFTREYFGYSLYGDTTPFDFNGYMKYGDPVEDVQFRNYKESSQSLYTLNDEELRVIIKLAILRNNSNASVKDIDTLLDMLFGAEVYYIDRMNMTVVSYMLSTAYQRIFNIAKSSGLLPNPAAVGTSLIVVPDTKNIFSYSLYGGDKSSFAVGYVDYFKKWADTGDQYTIIDSPHGMAQLTTGRIVLADSGGLQVLDFNGSVFVAVGNKYLIHGSGMAIAALTPSIFAVIDRTTNTLQAYTFDGEHIAPQGNSLSITTGFNPSIVGLTSTRIAICNGIAVLLQAYDFDGTDFTAAGNPLVFSINNTALARLSDSRVATMLNNVLWTWDFDETNWAVVGSPYSLTSYLHSMCPLSDSLVATVRESQDLMEVYNFSGSAWSLVPYSLSLVIANSAIAIIGSDRIALANGATLQAYDFTQDLTGCMASYS